MPYRSELAVVDSERISDVWAGTPAGYALEVQDNRQVIAFYDEDRYLTVGERRLGEDAEWTFQRLKERVKWDSHNSIEMAIDDDGHIHLSGNMHVDPLVYFRTKEPWNVKTLQRAEMVGDREDRATYPRFFRGPDDEFVFEYRDGKSGQGERLFNIYDPDETEWRRLSDEPVLSGRGEMNAYPTGPVVGPDGYYHLAGVWRDTPHAQTNRDVFYARSRELPRPARADALAEGGASCFHDALCRNRGGSRRERSLHRR